MNVMSFLVPTVPRGSSPDSSPPQLLVLPTVPGWKAHRPRLPAAYWISAGHSWLLPGIVRGRNGYQHTSWILR